MMVRRNGMRRRVTTLVLVTLALGVTAWLAGAVAGIDGGCLVPAASAAGSTGCFNTS